MNIINFLKNKFSFLFISNKNHHSVFKPKKSFKNSSKIHDSKISGSKFNSSKIKAEEKLKKRLEPKVLIARQQKWDISQFKLPVVEGKKRFHDFSLSNEIMHGIFDLGFKYCTPVQDEVLEHTLKGVDVLAKAQTGTGKTAAFLITIIKNLQKTSPPSNRYLGEPRSVIVAPTRELALQIGLEAKKLSKYLSLNIVELVGGMNYQQQKDALARDFVDIIIATPGRLIDFIEQQEVHLDIVEMLVLDEADRMLNMGFISQVRKIVQATPRPGDRQTLLFSATLNDDVINLANQWSWSFVNIEIEPESLVNPKITQILYLVSSDMKYKLLYNLIKFQDIKRGIIFSNWRAETKKLSEKLNKSGIKADFLSGDVSQKMRIKVLEDFKNKKIDILVATDVAGRGIHIKDVSHVINFNLPEDPDDYVHRIGRTGRAGQHGKAISFVCENDAFLIEELETFVDKKFMLEHPSDSLLK